MNTALLEYAVEVEKTGSITQAAANLFMEQPNLSKAVKSLEESLGAPIFTRTSKGMVPTARGRIFLNYAKNILAQIEEMEQLYKTNGEKGVEFSLSMPRASYLSFAFSKFIGNMDHEDTMNVWMRETNTAAALKAVESGECNLGIIRFPSLSEKYYAQTIAAAGLTTESVLGYTARILMSADHPLAQKEEIEAEDLLPYVEILHGDGSTGRNKNLKKGQELLKSLRRIYVFERGSQFDLLCENPNTYMWVSPMPAEILSRYGLVEKYCKNQTRRFLDVLICKKKYSYTTWDKEFFKQLELVKKSL